MNIPDTAFKGVQSFLAGLNTEVYGVCVIGFCSRQDLHKLTCVFEICSPAFVAKQTEDKFSAPALQKVLKLRAYPDSDGEVNCFTEGYIYRTTETIFYIAFEGDSPRCDSLRVAESGVMALLG